MKKNEQMLQKKNIKIFLDTNVLLNYLTNREDDELEASIEIIKSCAFGQYEGYISLQCLPTIWFVLRKYDNETKRSALRELCSIFTIVNISQMEVLDAINHTVFTDFEDCLQSKCAKEANADFIITCNGKDFLHSEVRALSPNQFLNLFAY